MTVVILEDAAEDIELGRQFYESFEVGVGECFVDSVFADLERLAFLAGIHPAHFGFRRMLCRRFPSAIYYEVEGETTFVYAILDVRRDPIWLRSQLSERK